MPLALELKIYNNHKIISVPLQVSGHLIIRVENCWSTPTKDPAHTVQYSFIEEKFVFLYHTLNVILKLELTEIFLNSIFFVRENMP